ncbi:LOW QUALITY PROTEIN: hypothetical protein N665_0739s0001 [Sinapis alba]|nr:LOW QUALITY PROTEIN: hypothetical protein N665_0739s0001 [Sinapis alba]
MQASRRSARLNWPMEAPPSHSTPASSIPPVASSSSRKHLRKRFRRCTRLTPPREPSEPEIESLSEANSSNENSDDSHDTMRDVDLLPKETRYETSRAAFQAMFCENPAMLRPSKRPISARFVSAAASERYQDLKHRKFVIQQSLSLVDEKLMDVRKVVTEAGLIYTVFDADPFQPAVVKEFIANLLDAEKRSDGVAVYVRGSLVEFSPSLINSMYCFPEVDEDAKWLDENIDQVCAFLTDGRVKRWEDMSSKYLTATNQVLYKLVCSNWIPTTSYTAMNPERLRFIYLLYQHQPFDFGKLVYNQIMTMAENTKAEKNPTDHPSDPDSQVLLIQRIVPPDSCDEDLTGMPKPVVKDKKAGRGSGADSHAPNLEEDITRAIASLKAIRLRLRRGDYVHRTIPQTTEQSDEDSD